MSASRPSRWLASDDPASLPARLERMLRVLESGTGAPCAQCDDPLCGHHVLFSVAAGCEDAPRCPACLADELERPAAPLKDDLLRFVLRKDCLRRGWALANQREDVPAGTRPPCVWRTATPVGGAAPDAASVAAGKPSAADAAWDAGELGCGDLVLKLRLRLKDLAPGAVLHLTATDPGAPADLPAWCGLTGHVLRHADHPHYWIQRKD